MKYKTERSYLIKVFYTSKSRRSIARIFDSQVSEKHMYEIWALYLILKILEINHYFHFVGTLYNLHVSLLDTI